MFIDILYLLLYKAIRLWEYTNTSHLIPQRIVFPVIRLKSVSEFWIHYLIGLYNWGVVVRSCSLIKLLGCPDVHPKQFSHLIFKSCKAFVAIMNWILSTHCGCLELYYYYRNSTELCRSGQYKFGCQLLTAREVEQKIAGDIWSFVKLPEIFMFVECKISNLEALWVAFKLQF